MRRLGARIKTVFLAFAVLLHLASPWIVPAGIVAGRWGVVAVLALALLTLGIVAIRAESWVRKAHRVRRALVPGLQGSLERVAEGELRVAVGPTISVYPDPSANALVARSFGGRGVILLSQGMVNLLGEADLRVVLKWGREQLLLPGATLRSVCAVLASTVLRIAPKEWVEATLLGKPFADVKRHKHSGHPAFFLLFLVFYQYGRVFVRLAGEPASIAEVQGALEETRRKVENSAPRWQNGVRPGAASLYLFRPGFERSLLPLESSL